MRTSLRLWSLLLCGLLATLVAARPEKPAETRNRPEEALRTLVRGKVVDLSEALTRRKIKHSREELRGQVVLETESGELLPILPDWRGRAFFQDEHLRNRKVDLIARRIPGVPHLQVQSIYTFDEKDQRQMTDYWCDVCAIPMYEIKDCECCQGPIRLRFRPQELPEEFRNEK